MKTIRLGVGITLVSFSLITTVGAVAQITASSSPAVQKILVRPSLAVGAVSENSITSVTSVTVAQADSTTAHLDNAVAALDKGDKAATTQELKTGIAGLEAQAAQQKPTSFKDKLLAQASNLKALLPLIPTGALGNGILGKAVSLAKLASGGSQLEGILAAGSLLGKGSQLTSGLSGIGGALGALGGQSSGQSLISSALATVGKLNQGGLTAKAAEPVAKTQLSSILNLVKGVL